jgi:type IX secretion system PorP/SprF family membrane protein
MKKVALIGWCLTIVVTAFSQEVPIYNNYFNNPFFYNPSFAGFKRQAELTVLYRQQWTGLEGAPKFSSLTLTSPIGKGGLGLSLQNTTRGVITSSSTLVAASYNVSLSPSSKLAFGIAAGVGRNSLDINQVDLNDPAAARMLANSFYFEGQAGFNFQYKSLVIGFSLPQFFDRNLVDTQSLQSLTANPWYASISSIRVKLKMGSSLSFEPILLYKTNGATARWESYGTFYLKDVVWLGGLYRRNMGAAAQAGFQINKLIQLGYAYEFPALEVSEFNFNTHEFRLTLLIGKERVAENRTTKPKPIPAGLKRRN